MTTQEREPLTPRADEDEYTGNWSDWIEPEPEPEPEPVAARYAEPAYDDDDYDDEYYEPGLRAHVGARHRRGQAAPLRSKPRKGPYPAWAVPLLGVLAVLAVVAAVAVQIAKMSPEDKSGPMPTVVASAPPSSAAPSSAAPAAEANPALCPNEMSGTSIRGNGPGSTHTGPDAILALQNRYYVERNGQRVHEMFAPDATAPSVADIQAGIDSIPVGTIYCVQIMPGPFAGQHIMVVTETHPDSSRRVWPPQLVLTSTTGDRTLVSSIVPLQSEAAPR
ncbi:hypothetical protein GFY24_36750 [Nocardia sp. SYP-A9097]|uniref:hypothetical protein n=1 Tax=Nocardia sp. SYP-A9097 TaxID=2663237 RepID=UPI00129BA1E1|nr:hypothetical protein [Nocardia sp. SYP-A9097]MRH92906.1 hypothetical protein [Nocardia sp. SYP-A9097]